MEGQIMRSLVAVVILLACGVATGAQPIDLASSAWATIPGYDTVCLQRAAGAWQADYGGGVGVIRLTVSGGSATLQQDGVTIATGAETGVGRWRWMRSGSITACWPTY